MADDSVVDDGVSKIVTQFLLDTCRLKQPTKNNVLAATSCAVSASFRLIQNTLDVDAIPLTSGSVAEFYI